MSLPKRLYIVRIGGFLSAPSATLKDAMEDVRDNCDVIEPGEKFSYRVFEGSNSVECVMGDKGKWKERGK